MGKLGDNERESPLEPEVSSGHAPAEASLGNQILHLLGVESPDDLRFFFENAFPDQGVVPVIELHKYGPELQLCLSVNAIMAKAFLARMHAEQSGGTANAE